MLRRKKKQRFGVGCVGGGGVLWRRLFSLHTLGTEHASTSRHSDVSSLRGVYFCCVVCGSQNISFIQSVVRPEPRAADGSPAEVLVKRDSRLRAGECLFEGEHTARRSAMDLNKTRTNVSERPQTLSVTFTL